MTTSANSGDVSLFRLKACSGGPVKQKTNASHSRGVGRQLKWRRKHSIMCAISNQ